MPTQPNGTKSATHPASRAGWIPSGQIRWWTWRLGEWRDSLGDELGQQRRLLRQQDQAFAVRLAALRAEHAQIESEVALQQSRVAIAGRSESLHREQHQAGFISEMRLQLVESELLEQRARLGAMQRRALARRSRCRRPSPPTWITTDVVETVLDGLLASVTLVIMFVFDPVLAGLVAAGAALYALLRWAMHTPLRHATAEAIVWGARRDSHLLEIGAMPMGYHTLIGDMGTVLSGGQKQRLLIARALYRQPGVLLLDEATNHLDVDNERKISAAIRASRLTRIIVAHRPETIRTADRVINLDEPAGRNSKPLTFLADTDTDTDTATDSGTVTSA